jgi:hypothetical protein
MEELNAEDRERALARRTDVLGRESSR